MKVLMIEPGKAPYEAELDGSLESMQKAVGGGIEGYYPYAEPVAIVCNDEGKINGLALNRAIYNEDGEMIEIMAFPITLWSSIRNSSNIRRSSSGWLVRSSR